MKIYNVFSLKKDKDGGFISDIIDAGDAKNIPDLDQFIRNLSDYKFSYSLTDPDSDKLIQVQVYDEEKPGPSVIVKKKWYHDVYYEDHPEEYKTLEEKRGTF